MPDAASLHLALIPDRRTYPSAGTAPIPENGIN
jgi:hypothetical protein